jgi:ABC-type antimicrobial peptide transport system permease subunit
MMKRIISSLFQAFKKVLSLIPTAFLLGLSLLPLSTLLLAFPAFNSQESVLNDTTSSRSGWIRRQLRRIGALGAGLIILLVLYAVSIELVTRFSEMTGTRFLSERGQFSSIARGFLPAPSILLGKTEAQRNAILETMPPPAQDFFKTPLHQKLPPAFINYWPVVIFVVYMLDILLLIGIGKVPLSYNLRNVRVRWLTNMMTALAFTFVVGLLVFLLGFVAGMNNLTENTGAPGNVFVLSDGATDELFSNLAYGDLDNVERVVVTQDEKDRYLKTPITIAKDTTPQGDEFYLASKETYYSINQSIPNSDPPRRRFVQLRALADPDVAAKVHDVELYPGGKWFSAAGVDNLSRIQCVLGDGVAQTLGADAGKARLEPGDTFSLGDMTWIVTGIMKSEGKTFGSEIWAKRMNRIYEPFGKANYTTLVLRTAQNTREASIAFAHHLNKRYTVQKLKAFSEPDYYAELTKTNNDFLVAIVAVAVVMAIGGVFGMMTTMFASIAQRIRDIGVLRLLGFKRWQVLISFMMESLTIALIGGFMGCLLARFLAHGQGSTSTISGGGGGPGGKSVAISIDVGFEVIMMGMLFTMAMGRLGGLVPAMSAMRIKILDSLR